MNKQDEHDLSCPICGRIDAKLLTGKHHCKKPRKEKTSNEWIWPYLNADMVKVAKSSQPSQAEQLETGLKQIEQQE